VSLKDIAGKFFSNCLTTIRTLHTFPSSSILNTYVRTARSVTLQRCLVPNREGADNVGLLTARVHSNTGAQSDEVLAYQRHSLRLFNDAVPKSQSLTAKADYRSDLQAKHEDGLKSWSRGNASDLPGSVRLGSQHSTYCTDRVFPQ
jgi:preprotein translocase subunit SecA